MKQFLIYAVSLVLILSLNGCKVSSATKAQRKLSKANDLLEEAKKLDPTIKLTKIDSLDVKVVIPGSRVDSTFHTKPGVKTVIRNGKQTVTHEILPDGQTKLEGVVETDTVTQKVAVESDVYIQKITGYKSLVKGVLKINEITFWIIHSILSLFIVVWGARRIGIW